MSKGQILKRYTYTLIIISIVLVLTLSEDKSIYIPIFIMIHGQIFNFSSFLINIKVSQEIKYSFPVFFEKYKFDNGFSVLSGEYISILTQFDEDFNTLSPKLKENIHFINRMIKSGMTLLFVSVLIIIYIILF